MQGRHAYPHDTAHFVHAPSQWETMSHCNVVAHWLGAYTTPKWSPMILKPYDCFQRFWTLQWRQWHHGPPQLGCLFTSSSRLTANKHPISFSLARCVWNPSGTGRFPSQRASDTERVSMSRRHNVAIKYGIHVSYQNDAMQAVFIYVLYLYWTGYRFNTDAMQTCIIA